MHDILYLHGFGDCQPDQGAVINTLRLAAPTSTIHVPCYHPGGQIVATRIGAAISQCLAVIEGTDSGIVHIVGYSFGGLIAAIIADQHPERVKNVLLLAPAIDNYSRNYEGRRPSQWPMPVDYVEELKRYPARPNVVRPTTLVHGMLDNDLGGSLPWRIQRWAAEQSFHEIHLIDGIGHSLQPWLSAPPLECEPNGSVPSFQQLVLGLIAPSITS